MRCKPRQSKQQEEAAEEEAAAAADLVVAPRTSHRSWAPLRLQRLVGTRRLVVWAVAAGQHQSSPAGHRARMTRSHLLMVVCGEVAELRLRLPRLLTVG